MEIETDPESSTADKIAWVSWFVCFSYHLSIIGCLARWTLREGVFYKDAFLHT